MADSFAPIARVPTSIPRSEIVLGVENGTPRTYVRRYSFDVADADGKHMEGRNGDNLTAHTDTWVLTQAQKNALAACTTVTAVLKLVQDYMHTKAEGAIG